jgi:three-Cys-motif partner protein
MATIPVSYQGREQAYLKHTILKAYLQRLFMIIGRKEPVINYVDCFAGPWSEESETLEDTSIGISLQLMKDASDALVNIFGRSVKFRALYIEKDRKAYKKLECFLAGFSHPSVSAECINGDFTIHTEEIAEWTNHAFTFFFVDPKGWKKGISSNNLTPLLNLKKSEFLINLMYDFFNRAVSIDSHREDVNAILGESYVAPEGATAEERKSSIVNGYRSTINNIYSGKSVYVPIERPGRERVLYFLIYFTRNPVGIATFKEAAEDLDLVQRVTQLEVKVRSHLNNSPNQDLFGELTVNNPEPKDNKNSAKEYLLKSLSLKPVLMDYDTWSEMLEKTDFFPSDFQLAMKELIHEKKVKNLSVETKALRRRTKKPIKPAWPMKSEKWVTEE